jgi:hypothetical protein
LCFAFWGGDGVSSVLLCLVRDNTFFSLAMVKWNRLKPMYV